MTSTGFDDLMWRHRVTAGLTEEELAERERVSRGLWRGGASAMPEG